MSIFSKGPEKDLSEQGKNGRGGFSLPELLIVVSIIAVLMTVILMNQSSYSEQASIYNLADDIGITISQAQAYGVGVRELDPGSATFSSAYGVSVSLLSGSQGSPTAYIFFGDADNNGAYDGNWSCSGECLGKTDILRGNMIDEICIIQAGNVESCNNIGRVDISFARPNTEATIRFFDSSGNQFSPPSIGARVKLVSPNGFTSAVSVLVTGQISTQ